jgi:16S rRNA (adenine1518-N6/adenine1519-N6)-dimethyltransferase
MNKHGARAVKAALNKSGVRPSKKRGQNFLIDQTFISEIALFGNPDFTRAIVEIGPGLGALTAELAPATDLTLIEIEPEFCSALKIKFPHAKILNKDVREIDFSDLGKELIVFGNLPYVYSTDIIFCLIDNRAFIDRAVLLLQQEFAERLAAGPGGKTFGVLSIMAQMWADIKLGPLIKGDAFQPPTKVNSRLVELKFLQASRFEISDYDFFRKLVRASFHQRRKMIGNSISAAGFASKEKVHGALKACGIDSSRRAETLSIKEFVTLSEALK